MFKGNIVKIFRTESELHKLHLYMAEVMEISSYYISHWTKTHSNFGNRVNRSNCVAQKDSSPQFQRHESRPKRMPRPAPIKKYVLNIHKS